MRVAMNLRCVFHVSPASTVQAKASPKPLNDGDMPEATAAQPEPQRPRGRAFETWSRARGWASED
jgi:hypothetical protein